jgi:hypothetical protein
MIAYLHRKAWERAFAEDLILHLAEEETAPSAVPGEFCRAFLFADLCSFTPLTEVMGDAAAARWWSGSASWCVTGRPPAVVSPAAGPGR